MTRQASSSSENGLIEVDGALRTSAKGVWAIGDLVPGPALAHKASDEGIIAVEDAAGLETHPIEYVDIPRATFCNPNVASFGLTEEQAREAGHDVTVGKVQYGAVGAGTVYGDRSGLIKVVGDKRYGELLGGHIVGSKSTELIQELVNVKLLEGGYPELARIIHGHPTLSEARHGGGTGSGWLAHPRLTLPPSSSTSARRRPTSPPSARCTTTRASSGSRCSPATCPAPRAGSRSAAPRSATSRWRTIERTAAEQGLQPVRWPDPFPFDSLVAMHVATYAKQIGRTVAFALAAYRQAFAGGRSLAETDNVVIAAAACEMHPAAVVKAAQLRGVGERLEAATARAIALGVRDVPAVWDGERVTPA